MKSTPIKIKKFDFMWVRGAYRMMSGSSLHLSCVFLMASTALLSLAFGKWAYAATGVFFLLYVATWVVYYKLAQATALAGYKKFVDEWIRSAPTDEGQNARRGMLTAGGLGAALGAAGYSAMDHAYFTPSINVDGTPMVDGSSFDIKGNPYGVTSDATGQWNTDTGQFVAENNSYVSPIGMNDN